MLKVDCDYCKKELTEPGALLFSPPSSTGHCKKIHICVSCFEILGKEEKIKTTEFRIGVAQIRTRMLNCLKALVGVGEVFTNKKATKDELDKAGQIFLRESIEARDLTKTNGK